MVGLYVEPVTTGSIKPSGCSLKGLGSESPRLHASSRSVARHLPAEQPERGKAAKERQGAESKGGADAVGGGCNPASDRRTDGHADITSALGASARVGSAMIAPACSPQLQPGKTRDAKRKTCSGLAKDIILPSGRQP
jgi:hypothetical protein